MRARMALHYSGIEVEIREIALKAKPAHMLAVSPKGTVPVLVLGNDRVIDESLNIMRWALAQRDTDAWLAEQSSSETLIVENDGSFKQALDRYKYAIRFPDQPAETYRAMGERFLAKLDTSLQARHYLVAEHITLADIAIFPFIRQFSMVDEAWFSTAPYPYLREWLTRMVTMPLFESVMQKYPTWIEA
jgi:glutathione S-transferase